jgi:phosphopantothenoylcysteine synthetase/decarboxylase
MHVLVTAGNTQVFIDRVRCLTNVFTGRTGARVAAEADGRGHAVTLLTSTPAQAAIVAPTAGWHLLSYRTFDELHQAMAAEVRFGRYDAVIHSAAVSDYLSGGVYAPAAGTHFDAETATWHGRPAPALTDRRAGKVKSDDPELWLRLVRAPKLIDQVRSEWDFRGVLVKFKLEVGVGEAELRVTAERSRLHSQADLMVANTLEHTAEWALLGPVGGGYDRVGRTDLAARLIDAVEHLHGIQRTA